MTSYLAALAASCCLLLPALSQAQTPAIAHGAAVPATPAAAHDIPKAAPHEKLPPSMRPLSPPVPVYHPPRRLPQQAVHYARPAAKRQQHAAAARRPAMAPSLRAAAALASRLLPRGQHGDKSPRLAVLACADGAPRHGAQGTLYLVQNPGNQLLLGEAGVSHAVRQLRTPLLLVLASADCKAVNTARGDFSALPLAEQRTLLSINVDKGGTPLSAQLDNLDNQVEAAVLHYGGEVEAGRLSVIGAYYDAAGQLGKRGQLVVTSINGERDKATIARLLRQRAVFNAATGIGTPLAGAGH
ncbi:hypothetical protein [Vogesella alkaliphila]|uniref:Carbonic anhydrase n=1 Tax=Vogesella alkaliphila TaxID=1193621 RepID=A0ABQ2YF69_9NEIS|nr:hypothetical protein [Vogesella alkaliphila]GGX81718.1 hypothetical protein GCM10011290_06390 [Vogesella alkaliphila]